MKQESRMADGPYAVERKASKCDFVNVKYNLEHRRE